eukprot:TRINITY_DN73325_c0_g1_i1.p1 TRINITY_DN73325_c0_g1~~TRINITY_DN73325_c0_g1_i1.p1  ORF type:complete len:547 (-),score=69.80 TRINITY_DN73325_c0_g1_i1:29-1669(-)
MVQLERLLEDLGIGKYQVLQCFLLGGVWLVDGAEMLVSSAILGALQGAWHMSSWTKGLIVALVFVGVGVGSIVGGHFADNFGRRRVTLLNYFGVCLFGATTALVHGPVLMAATRFGLGFCFGSGLSARMALVMETTSSAGGKHLCNLSNIWFAIGEVYAALLMVVYMPYLVDPTDSTWRQVAVLSVLPSVMLMPGMLFVVQESPAYLLSEGRKEEAHAVVSFIANFNHDTRVVNELQTVKPADLHTGEEEPLLHAASSVPNHGSVTQPLEEPAPTDGVSSKTQHGLLVGLRDIIMKPEWRWALFAGSFLCMMSNAIYYGVSYLLPELLRGMDLSITPAMELLLAASASLPGVGLADLLLLCRRLSDKDRMIVFSACIGTLLVLLGQELPVRIQLAVLCCLKAMVFGFFSLVYVVVGRIFPCHIRCTASSICFTGGRIGSIMSPLLCEIMRSEANDFRAFFLLCTFLCLFAILIIRFALDDYDYEYVEVLHTSDIEESDGKTLPPLPEQHGLQPRLSRRVSLRRSGSDKLGPAMQTRHPLTLGGVKA